MDLEFSDKMFDRNGQLSIRSECDILDFLIVERNSFWLCYIICVLIKSCMFCKHSVISIREIYISEKDVGDRWISVLMIRFLKIEICGWPLEALQKLLLKYSSRYNYQSLSDISRRHLTYSTFSEYSIWSFKTQICCLVGYVVGIGRTKLWRNSRQVYENSYRHGNFQSFVCDPSNSFYRLSSPLPVPFAYFSTLHSALLASSYYASWTFSYTLVRGHESFSFDEDKNLVPNLRCSMRRHLLRIVIFI